MIPKTDSNITQDPLDALIDRTLARDAENTRDRFAIVPNMQLTTKLALTTASRGLLGGLASKLALYTGAAIMVGAAIYLMPNLNQQPHPAVSIPAPIAHQSVSKPVMQTDISTKAVTPHHPSKIDSEPAPPNVAPSPAPHSIQLDEGDGKNIPKITDPNYLPPLK